MTDTPRLSIDWDGEGAFAVITRPGQSAEVIRLPDHDRLATEAMTAALAMRGRVVVRPARWPSNMQKMHDAEGALEPHIGRFGE